MWGLARFGDAATRARVESVGVRTVACDLGSGDFSNVPADFDYVLHLATFRNGRGFSTCREDDSAGGLFSTKSDTQKDD